MRALKTTAVLLAGLLSCAGARGQKLDPYLTYPEGRLATETHAGWDTAALETVLGFVGTDVRPVRHRPFDGPVSDRWSATAWRGDRVHTQFIISSREGIPYFEATAGELTSADGGRIPAENVNVSMVRYVITDGLNAEGCGCGIPTRDQFTASLSPDAIDVTAAGSLEPRTVRPFWLSIDIPRGTPPGEYRGSVTVRAGALRHELPFTVEVKEWTLTEPSEWAFHLDLWQNPYSVARFHGVPVWSAQHFELMRPLMGMLASAGQKTVTVSMIHDPWRSQTYDVYSSMIKWIKRADGSWRYDYTDFDRWVEFMFSLGIDRLINCYTMVPWNNAFWYHDELSGRDMVLVAATGTPGFEAHWRPMLADFSRHLREKGWFGHTAIAMDERPLQDMQHVIRLVREVDPDFKISLAGVYHPEIEPFIHDYCTESAGVFPPEVLGRRKAQGRPSTFYTYCYEGYPNTFTFSPPGQSEWMAWYAAAAGFDGYLRWAYNCWPEAPLQDSRFSTWSAGDTYLVYPGARSSVRFERLMEGVRTYEKIRLLREHFAATGYADGLEEIERMLSPFSIPSLDHTPAAEMIRRARQVLDSL